MRIIIRVRLYRLDIQQLIRQGLTSRFFGAQDRGGILPGLQKLSYAGKNLEDSQRKLEQCVT